MLNGKKTYIAAAVLGLASFAMALGWLEKEQYQVIVGLVGSLGLASLRSGVGKSITDKAQEGVNEKVVTVTGAAQVVKGIVGGNG